MPLKKLSPLFPSMIISPGSSQSPSALKSIQACRIPVPVTVTLIGVVIAVVCGLLILCVCVYCCHRRMQQYKKMRARVVEWRRDRLVHGPY